MDYEAKVYLESTASLVQNISSQVFKNDKCIVDKDDIEFIVTELWRAKCAVTGERWAFSFSR